MHHKMINFQFQRSTKENNFLYLDTMKKGKEKKYRGKCHKIFLPFNFKEKKGEDILQKVHSLTLDFLSTLFHGQPYRRNFS